MREIDWIIHYVNDKRSEDDERVGSGFAECACNAHTHGMAKYHHKDFQIVLDLDPNEISVVLNMLAMRVQDGEKFHSGDIVSGIYEDCDVKLMEFEESGRMVLRVLIPDNRGYFPDDDRCHELLKLQMWPTDALYIESGVLN